MDINSKKAVIMMATYNGEKYIQEQIKSLQDQTFTNWDLYVSDDGSTDNTCLILNRIKQNEPRIKKILINQNEYHGAFANYFNVMNYVKKNCSNKYDYFFYCDQDDVWKKEKMSDQIRIIEKNSQNDKPVFCYSDLELCDVNLKDSQDKISNHIKQQFVENPFNEFFKEQYVWGTAMAHDRKLWDLIVVEDVNKIKNNIPHDSYVSRYAAIYANIKFIDRPLVLYRRTGNNVTGTPKTYSFITALRKMIHIPIVINNAASTYGATMYFLKKAPIRNLKLKEISICFGGNINKKINYFRKYHILSKEKGWNKLSTKIIFYSKIYKLCNTYKEIISY